MYFQHELVHKYSPECRKSSLWHSRCFWGQLNSHPWYKIIPFFLLLEQQSLLKSEPVSASGCTHFIINSLTSLVATLLHFIRCCLGCFGGWSTRGVLLLAGDCPPFSHPSGASVESEIGYLEWYCLWISNCSEEIHAFRSPRLCVWVGSVLING